MSRRAEDEREWGDTLVAEPESRSASWPMGTASGAVSEDGEPAPECLGAHGPFGPRYVLEALIGVGGMATVYRVYDRALDEVVALKVLRRDLAEDPDNYARFRREVKLARRVTHPNVARTFDIGEHEGTHFLTMEFVDGEPLSALLRRSGRLPEARIVELMLSVGDGLAAAHAAGVIHRDLKPDNVLVARDGRVVVTDFGIACGYDGHTTNTSEAHVLGTPLYMAPEQLDARATHDARTDIFALGGMMYHMATGAAPSPTHAASVLIGRMRGELPDASRLDGVSAPLAAIILRCMNPDPAARFSSVAELSAALGAVELPREVTPPERAASEPPGASSPRRGTATRERSKKNVLLFPLRSRGAADDSFLADGLTEDLMDVLRGVRGLSMTMHPTHPAGPEAELCALGRRLRMDVVVDGSVHRVDSDLRVSVRLYTTRDGLCFWSARFRAPLRELFELSDDVARAVAERLALRAGKADRRPPTDAGAMDAYLRGRAALRNVWPTSLRDALAHLGRARDLAPRDPTILATYARAATRLWFWTGGDREGDAARIAARRAMELAPTNAEARLALAGVCFMRNQHGRALGLISDALEVSPGLPEPRELRGRILLELGEIERGLDELKSAASLDVRYDQPIERSRGLALLGDWPGVEATLAEWRHGPDEASARAIVCARLALWSPEPARIAQYAPPFEAVTDPGRDYVQLARSLTASGGQLDADARSRLDGYAELSRRSRRFAILIHQLSAEVFAFAGARGAALHHIERAAVRGLVDIAWLDHCPLLTSLRDDARSLRARARVEARTVRAREVLRRGQ